MLTSDFEDSDGYKLKFEEDCSEIDKQFFVSEYTNVNSVAKKKLHCTTCKKHISTAPSSGTIIRTHQILGVTQCNKCFAFYNSGEFEKDENGEECFCRWCGQGGEVYCCSTCPFVFCRKCIRSNLSNANVKEVEASEDWSCFVCNKDMLKSHRAQHWALRNFMEKQLEVVQKTNDRGDGQTEDASNRSSRKTRQSLGKVVPIPPYVSNKRRPSSTQVKPPAKKSAHEPMQKLPLRTAPAAANKPSTSGGKNSEIVRTPDIPIANMMPSTITPLPLVMREQAALPTATAFMPWTAQFVATPRGSELGPSRQANPKTANAAARRMSRPQISAPRPRTVQAQRRSTVSYGRVMLSHNTQLTPPLPPAAAPSKSTIFKLQNGSIAVARATQPNTPLGTSKTELDGKIINVLEICQLTINKTITLTNSTSFKSSNSLKDVKDLNDRLHLLLTYHFEKLKPIQESIATESERLAKHAATKEKCDADELKIVEEETEVIEVVSDDEGETAAAPKMTPIVVKKEA